MKDPEGSEFYFGPWRIARLIFVEFNPLTIIVSSNVMSTKTPALMAASNSGWTAGSIASESRKHSTHARTIRRLVWSIAFDSCSLHLAWSRPVIHHRVMLGWTVVP